MLGLGLITFLNVYIMYRLANDLDFTRSGHEALDREHEIFIEILKRIVRAYKDNWEATIKDGLLNELHKFIDFHFTSEENLMLISNASNYQKHKEDHQCLKEVLGSIINVFDVEQLDLNDLMDFICIRLRDHANSFDFELGQHLVMHEKLGKELS